MDASSPAKTQLIERLRESLDGVLGAKPMDQCMDAIHEELLSAGIREEDALEINKQILDAHPPTFPRFSTFELFLTTACNLACSYCFIHHERSTAMTPDIVAGSIQFILEQRDAKRPTRVVFMGGEPLSEFGLIREVIDHLSAEPQCGGAETRFDITSNGTLITEEKMKYLSQHNVMVLLSIDGGRETHDRQRKMRNGRGSFDYIVKKLPMIMKYQPYLGTKMTPTPETVDVLLADVKELVGLGLRRILIGPATGIDWSPDSLRVLSGQVAAILEWRRTRPGRGLSISFDEVEVNSKPGRASDEINCWGCRAGRTGIAIDVDGSLSPCSKVIGASRTAGEVLSLGTVFAGQLNGEVRSHLCGAIPKPRLECRQCEIKTVCRGGCPATNHEATGSPFEPASNVCDTARAIVRGCQNAGVAVMP